MQVSSSKVREFRERLIAEIEERIAILRQEEAEIQAELDALPPPLIPGPGGRVMREDFERDMARGARHNKLVKQRREVFDEMTALRKQLRELRKGA